MPQPFTLIEYEYEEGGLKEQTRIDMEFADRVAAAKAELAEVGSERGELTPPDNTNELGPFFHFWEYVRPGWHFYSVALTREIEAPWRYGWGVAIRGPRRVHVFGIWGPGEAPSFDKERQEIAVDWNIPPGSLLDQPEVI